VVFGVSCDEEKNPATFNGSLIKSLREQFEATKVILTVLKKNSGMPVAETEDELIT